MNKKTKRYFLTALIAIVPLSIIAVSSSVMAACSISIGVRCDSSYGKYETFEGAASISNNESRRVDFTMTITLKDPSGHTLDTDSRSGSLGPGQYNEYPLNVAPPSGGWQPGTYEFCNQVVAAGINGCMYVKSICKGFTGPPSPSIWISPALFNIKLLPDVVSNHILTIGNSGNSVLEFNITNEFIQSGWPKTTGSDVNSSPALGDIDGDGDIEVVVGSWDKKVYAWHHDGSAVTGWPKTTGNSVYSSPALGDIDGDGDIEVVVGSHGGKVYAWHHDGSDVTGWPKTTGSDVYSDVYSSPALGDIDGDGDIEVVVGSNDNKVYAWDCFGTYDSNNIEWGMFHHDINHTGLYGYVPPGTGGTGSQTALKEVDWLSEDPTNGTVDPGTQASITVTLDTTSLDFGDYYADIIITSNDPDENPLIIPVHLTVEHIIDIGGFAADFGRADCIGDCPGDSDGDEDVDGSDLAEFAKNLGLQNP